MTKEQKLKSYRDDIDVLKRFISITRTHAVLLSQRCDEMLAEIEVSESLRRAKPKPSKAIGKAKVAKPTHVLLTPFWNRRGAEKIPK